MYSKLLCGIICSPADNFLEGYNVVKFFMGKKRQTFQLLPNGIESTAHTHGIYSRLNKETTYTCQDTYYLFYVTNPHPSQYQSYIGSE